MLVERVLVGEGCAVMNAGDGAQALEMLEHRQIDIDLVITDIDMPKLDGLELGRRVARMNPRMPVLYMSSELPEGFVDRAAELTLPPFLLKPFSIATLVAAVVGLLATSRAPLGTPATCGAPNEQGESLT